jgi:hypothetical protein
MHEALTFLRQTNLWVFVMQVFCARPSENVHSFLSLESDHSFCPFFIIWHSWNSVSPFFIIWKSQHKFWDHFLSLESDHSFCPLFIIWHSWNSVGPYFIIWKSQDKFWDNFLSLESDHSFCPFLAPTGALGVKMLCIHPSVTFVCEKQFWI